MCRESKKKYNQHNFFLVYNLEFELGLTQAYKTGL